MLEHYQRHVKAGQHNAKEKTFCRRYRMICYKSLSTRKLYHFAPDFDRVLLQLVGTDIENSLFQYRVSYGRLTFMIKTFELL